MLRTLYRIISQWMGLGQKPKPPARPVIPPHAAQTHRTVTAPQRAPATAPPVPRVDPAEEEARKRRELARRQRQLDKADMEARLRQAGKMLPTPIQWEIILASDPLVRVVAGAGSGKSSTLVLRVLYLHHYLKRPWDEITVVTFTRNSRKDFIEKLGKMASLWGAPPDQEQLEAVVRTFHSALFNFARQNGVNPKVLDLAKKENSKGTGGDDPPFPPLSFAVDSELARLLTEVGAKLMAENAVFRSNVVQLYDLTFVEQALVSDATKDDAAKLNGRIFATQKRDMDRTAHMEKLWAEKVAPHEMGKGLIRWLPTEFSVASNSIPGLTGSACGPWWANAYVPEMKAYVLLGGTSEELGKESFPDTFDVMHGLGAKKSCVNVLTSETLVVWLNKREDLMRLHARIAWGNDPAPQMPKFALKLTGELKEAPFLEALWQQAQFVQSLGIDVGQAAKQAAAGLKGKDRLFAQALAEFWPAFERELESKGLTLSNRLFAEMSGSTLLTNASLDSLRWANNLLIDEFQDISGNIASWLKAVRAELQRRARPADLMVVGDDWQSIYGWRGASPKFFTEFGARIGAGGIEPKTYLLTENFRSSQNIVDAAGQVVRAVHDKIDKACTAKGENAANAAKVRLIEGVDLRASRVLAPLAPAEGSLYLLSRRNQQTETLGLDEGKFFTVHGSKGLEADHVVFLDDFLPPPSHPFRTQCYAAAKLGNYDKAQADEARRLAYVALTRAKKTCTWVIQARLRGGLFGELAEANSPAIYLDTDFEDAPATA